MTSDQLFNESGPPTPVKPKTRRTWKASDGMPQAKQRLVLVGRIQRQQVVRTGVCPMHNGRRLTKYLGAQESGWVFYCPEGAHAVVNRPAEGEAVVPPPKGDH